jgi:aryl-alcohol dehydrogenase-like predicted oxidoreductase
MSMLDRVRFGRTGLGVTRIAFGGIPIQRPSQPDGIQPVTDTLALGVNFLATAHGCGHSEELIGEAIQAVPRDSIVIATKCPATDRRTLLADLDESLRRLRTDHVDIFQLHGVSSRSRKQWILAASS